MCRTAPASLEPRTTAVANAETPPASVKDTSISVMRGSRLGRTTTRADHRSRARPSTFTMRDVGVLHGGFHRRSGISYGGTEAGIPHDPKIAASQAGIRRASRGARA